ncbi:uncharacterized protein LOC135826329, partial [Sycon ciliatum]|uniref:uncharacterized protein LOC135826329 n=1 Tax=Sycon ciliatum TaxID=27933 RepID=UPI0031F71EE0
MKSCCTQVQKRTDSLILFVTVQLLLLPQVTVRAASSSTSIKQGVLDGASQVCHTGVYFLASEHTDNRTVQVLKNTCQQRKATLPTASAVKSACFLTFCQSVSADVISGGFAFAADNGSRYTYDGGSVTMGTLLSLGNYLVCEGAAYKRCASGTSAWLPQDIRILSLSSSNAQQTCHSQLPASKADGNSDPCFSSFKDDVLQYFRSFNKFRTSQSPRRNQNSAVICFGQLEDLAFSCNPHLYVVESLASHATNPHWRTACQKRTTSLGLVKVDNEPSYCLRFFAQGIYSRLGGRTPFAFLGTNAQNADSLYEVRVNVKDNVLMTNISYQPGQTSLPVILLCSGNLRSMCANTGSVAWLPSGQLPAGRKAALDKCGPLISRSSMDCLPKLRQLLNTMLPSFGRYWQRETTNSLGDFGIEQHTTAICHGTLSNLRVSCANYNLSVFDSTDMDNLCARDEFPTSSMHRESCYFGFISVLVGYFGNKTVSVELNDSSVTSFKDTFTVSGSSATRLVTVCATRNASTTVASATGSTRVAMTTAQATMPPTAPKPAMTSTMASAAIPCPIGYICLNGECRKDANNALFCHCHPGWAGTVCAENVQALSFSPTTVATTT